MLEDFIRKITRRIKRNDKRTLAETRGKTSISDAIVIPPTQKEIAKMLADKDGDALARHSKRFVDAICKKVEAMSKLDVPQDVINKIKEAVPPDAADDVDYLQFSEDELQEWFSDLSICYDYARMQYGRAKGKRDKWNKYHDIVELKVKQIYSGLDELQKFGYDECIEYVSEIKADLPEDVAERYVYGSNTDEQIELFIDELEGLLLEVRENISKIQKKNDELERLEIGKLSISVLGTDTLDNLDDVLRTAKEAEQKQRDERIKSVAINLSAVKGDKASLASVFNSAFPDKRIEEQEAMEANTEETDDMQDNLEIISNTVSGENDSVVSSEQG